MLLRRYSCSRALFPGLALSLAAVAAVSAAAPAPAGQNAGRADPHATTSEIVAEVDGEPITDEQVVQALGVNLTRLQEQIYALKRQAIETLVSQRVLAHEAARRQTTPTAFVVGEVTAKVTEPTDAEVDAYYDAHRGSFHAASEDGQVRAHIRTALLTEKTLAARQALIQSLRAGAHVAVYLAGPSVQRFDLQIADAPVLGSASAPVTIVEFSDFHCPFCQRFETAHTAQQLLARYGDRVKIVWLDDPIDQLHPQSRQAHEAARCAGGQGKFWAYHDVLYAGPPRMGEGLDAAAREVGLDTRTFDACIATGKYRAAVQRDVEQAQRLSVSGTPTFFINGRPLFGAQAFDAFAQVIDDELARTATPAAPR
jgi:protein-disulfide isomerase